jgi:hypothetical protein
VGSIWSDRELGYEAIHLLCSERTPMGQLAHDLEEEPQVTWPVRRQPLLELPRHVIYLYV